jgi:hypothetical protein
MPPVKRPSLALESLDERVVPAVVNLNLAGSAGTLNGAQFIQRSHGADDDASLSFLRLQESNLLSSLFGGAEEGYNTSARPLQFDAVGGLNVTRSLKLSEIPEVTIGGVQYREFLLTVNQPANSPTITLDELRIFVSGNGSLRGYNTNNGRLAGLTASYNMDAGGNNSVRINDNLNKTDADVRVLIPSSVLGSNPDSYIYLYSKFSSAPLTSLFSRYESWAVNVPQSTTTTATLSGRVLGPVFSPEGELSMVGVAGVKVTLSGGSVNGELVTYTDALGNFSFEVPTGGSYHVTVSEYQDLTSPSYGQVAATNVGDADGDGANDGEQDGFGNGESITDIMLADGGAGTGYEFVLGFSE